MFSVILALFLTFGLTVPAFASDKIKNNDETPQYFLIKAAQTPYGTMYYIQERCDIQGRSVWDLVDILMAGASWAKMLSEPSWGNFGWAVLDTAALLPLLPSTAYFRQGGKVLLKADEVAKFAKTSKGKRLLRPQ